MIRRFLALTLLRAAGRGLRRLLTVAVVAGLLAAAAPVSLVAAGAAVTAWLGGWPPGPAGPRPWPGCAPAWAA